MSGFEDEVNVQVVGDQLELPTFAKPCPFAGYEDNHEDDDHHDDDDFDGREDDVYGGDKKAKRRVVGLKKDEKVLN